MLKPEDAAQLLKRHRLTGIDDPTEVAYPIRWYWSTTGYLTSCPWRSLPTCYPIKRGDNDRPLA
jgi:hypothetical protein